ncbi:MAG: hypothetical protein JO005_04170 [Gammaproteobacteria bacterium]|nr:hypothetical protein [Gammaproteobacteria bacterium]
MRTTALLLLLLLGDGAVASELARSATVQVQGSTVPGGLAVTVQGDATHPPQVSGVSARLGARQVEGTRQPDGSWFLPVGVVPGGPFELIVAHDGIRELLAAQAPPAAAAPAVAAPAVRRKQLIWWVLNIGIVAVAALVISRRMG